MTQLTFGAYSSLLARPLALAHTPDTASPHVTCLLTSTAEALHSTGLRTAFSYTSIYMGVRNIWISARALYQGKLAAVFGRQVQREKIEYKRKKSQQQVNQETGKTSPQARDSNGYPPKSPWRMESC